MVVLIDDRVPPFRREPERPVWEPNWRVWSWVLAALAAAVGCYLTDGFASFVLLCAAIGFAAQACSRALPYDGGLREHRQ
jgi:hypothetical protein